MQIIPLLSHFLKSGKVDLSTNNEIFLQLTAKTHQIDLNIVNNRFLKDLMKEKIGIGTFQELFRQLKNAAEELKSEGMTMTVSYKGVTVLTLGFDAKPNFSQFVTGTTKIEINNLRKLIQIGLF